MPHLPDNHVVGAGRIAAQAQPPDYASVWCIERKAAAEGDDSSDCFAHHRITSSSAGLQRTQLRIVQAGKVKMTIASGEEDISGPIVRCCRIGFIRTGKCIVCLALYGLPWRAIRRATLVSPKVM